MRIVYDLKLALENDPDRVRDTQALTLDKSKSFGLEGKYGLYGSKQWWDNLQSAVIPTKEYEGVIQSLGFVGMHNETSAFTMKTREGEEFTFDLMANDKQGLKKYITGRKIRLIFIEEVKKNGEVLDMLWTVELEDG